MSEMLSILTLINNVINYIVVHVVTHLAVYTYISNKWQLTYNITFVTKQWGMVVKTFTFTSIN